MTALLLPLLPHILAALVGGLGIVGAVWYVRRSGVRAQQLADTQQQLAQVKSRERTDAEVAAMPDAAVDQQLRDNWTRK